MPSERDDPRLVTADRRPSEDDYSKRIRDDHCCWPRETKPQNPVWYLLLALPWLLSRVCSPHKRRAAGSCTRPGQHRWEVLCCGVIPGTHPGRASGTIAAAHDPCGTWCEPKCRAGRPFLFRFGLCLPCRICSWLRGAPYPMNRPHMATCCPENGCCPDTDETPAQQRRRSSVRVQPGFRARSFTTTANPTAPAEPYGTEAEVTASQSDSEVVPGIPTDLEGVVTGSVIAEPQGDTAQGDAAAAQEPAVGTVPAADRAPASAALAEQAAGAEAAAREDRESPRAAAEL
eukprot:TRINITY_DN4363_c0_g1_i3.p1 TRINITY_DN4363_c0_g1~~TRINITY_DN4363_c0_g1_i3.p1  ORF type:complete len:314 (+),score=84.02 TRINITY_DN4363_c0_g1_i3:79-942(+)